MTSIPAYCPVCKQKNISIWSIAKDYEYFSVENEFSYYNCNDCSTIFIHPIPIDLLQKIYPPNYYSFKNAPKNIVFQLKKWLDRRFFKKILSQFSVSQINILDIGGGTGWMINELKKIDQRIAFTQIVDLDRNAKQFAENDGHAYFEGRIESFDTETKFHIILLLNLIEHVADPLEVLQKVNSFLAPGGMIVIKTPNTESWDARLFKKTYWGGLHSPRHWIIFSEKSFNIILRSTKLKIKKLNYTQGAPFWAFSIIATLYRKKIINVSAQNPIIFHWLFAPLSAVFAIFDFFRKPFTKTSQMFIVLGKEGDN